MKIVTAEQSPSPDEDDHAQKLISNANTTLASATREELRVLDEEPWLAAESLPDDRVGPLLNDRNATQAMMEWTGERPVILAESSLERR